MRHSTAVRSPVSFPEPQLAHPALPHLRHGQGWQRPECSVHQPRLRDVVNVGVRLLRFMLALTALMIVVRAPLMQFGPIAGSTCNDRPCSAVGLAFDNLTGMSHTAMFALPFFATALCVLAMVLAVAGGSRPGRGAVTLALLLGTGLVVAAFSQPHATPLPGAFVYVALIFASTAVRGRGYPMMKSSLATPEPSVKR